MTTRRARKARRSKKIELTFLKIIVFPVYVNSTDRVICSKGSREHRLGLWNSPILIIDDVGTAPKRSIATLIKPPYSSFDNQEDLDGMTSPVALRD